MISETAFLKKFYGMLSWVRRETGEPPVLGKEVDFFLCLQAVQIWYKQGDSLRNSTGLWANFNGLIGYYKEGILKSCGSIGYEHVKELMDSDQNRGNFAG